MTYGYARCSTNETKQDINRQVRELKAAGAEHIFLEYEHGDSKVKSQQAAMFAQAQAGDIIITLEVPRLARSTQQLCEIIDRVREGRLCLVIVGSITLDCREGRAAPMTEAFLQIAGVFSQLELSMIRERVRSGMANAKAKGKQIGRPQETSDFYSIGISKRPTTSPVLSIRISTTNIPLFKAEYPSSHTEPLYSPTLTFSVVQPANFASSPGNCRLSLSVYVFVLFGPST